MLLGDGISAASVGFFVGDFFERSGLARFIALFCHLFESCFRNRILSADVHANLVDCLTAIAGRKGEDKGQQDESSEDQQSSVHGDLLFLWENKPGENVPTICQTPLAWFHSIRLDLGLNIRSQLETVYFVA